MESRRGALLFTLAVLAMLASDQGTSCPRADTLNRYTGYEINCALILLVCCRHCHPQHGYKPLGASNLRPSAGHQLQLISSLLTPWKPAVLIAEGSMHK